MIRDVTGKRLTRRFNARDHKLPRLLPVSNASMSTSIIQAVPVEAPPSYHEAVRRAKRATNRTSIATLPDDDERTPLLVIDSEPTVVSPPFTLSGYFEPLIRRDHWLSVIHLILINFPFALVVWLYLFLGVLVGTTLLLTLPLGMLKYGP